MVDVNELTPFEIGFCMGLIAGEGSFTSGGEYDVPKLIVGVGHNDPKMLYYLQRCLGGKVYGIGTDQHHIQWRLNTRELARLIPFFHKHLPDCHKREQFLAWAEKHKNQFWNATHSTREDSLRRIVRENLDQMR